MKILNLIYAVLAIIIAIALSIPVRSILFNTTFSEFQCECAGCLGIGAFVMIGPFTMLFEKK